MSNVTNIMIMGSGINKKDEKQIKNAFAYHTGYKINKMSGKMGGNKAIESNIYVGAFNGLNENLLFKILKDIKKNIDPIVFNNMQIALKTEHDMKWHIHLINEFKKKFFYIYNE